MATARNVYFGLAVLVAVHSFLFASSFQSIPKVTSVLGSSNDGCYRSRSSARKGAIPSTTKNEMVSVSFLQRSDVLFIGRRTVLGSATDGKDTTTTSSVTSIDTDALVKYGIALVTQMTLFVGFFSALDVLVSSYDIEIPFAVNVAMFYFFSLKSRIFNPLLNSRPNPNNMEIQQQVQDNNNNNNNNNKSPLPTRNMPQWTPPGFIFPIVWLLLIGPLRAYTSALIYDANGGVFTDVAILSLMLHLSIGDIWNTINNVERRYGASVIGVLFVWISAAHAAYRYGEVSELAGQLLSLSLIWLTIASSLIIQTWRLNPTNTNSKDGTVLDPLFPVMSADDNNVSKTKLIWFEK